jgi:hypothetical protein
MFEIPLLHMALLPLQKKRAEDFFALKSPDGFSWV